MNMINVTIFDRDTATSTKSMLVVKLEKNENHDCAAKSSSICLTLGEIDTNSQP